MLTRVSTKKADHDQLNVSEKGEELAENWGGGGGESEIEKLVIVLW